MHLRKKIDFVYSFVGDLKKKIQMFYPFFSYQNELDECEFRHKNNFFITLLNEKLFFHALCKREFFDLNMKYV